MAKENVVKIPRTREDELRKKSDYFDAVVEYVPEGLAMVDAKSRRVTLVSRYAALYVERSREELEGISADEVIERWDIFRADGTSRPAKEEFPIFRVINNKECIENEEWVFRKPSGARVTVLMNACPVLNESGEVSAAVISWVDISERKIASERLINMYTELNDALRKVKVLSGMLKVCAVCKRIQDDRGNWVSLEKFIEDRSQAIFSHGICPVCAERAYGEIDKKK